jgi:hypothetical protein
MLVVFGGHPTSYWVSGGLMLAAMQASLAL